MNGLSGKQERGHVDRRVFLSLVGIVPAAIAFGTACGTETKSSGSGDAASGDLALTHALLIDGSGRDAIEDATIVISGNEIIAAGAGVAIPAGAQIMDLAGKAVMPGLIDAHVHLGGLGIGKTPSFGGRDLTDDYAVPRSMALQYGVTTERTLGDFLDDSIQLRDEVERGTVVGPRIFTSGPSFQSEGGHPNSTVWGSDPTVLAAAARTPTTPEAAATMVDELADAGVDVIKVIISSMTMPGSPPSAPKLPWNIVEAVVKQAHARNLIVCTHTEDVADSTRAVELGVDDIAHMRHGVGALSASEEADYDDLFRLMVSKGTYLVPTMIVNVRSDIPLTEIDMTTLTVGNPVVKRAYDAGVKLGVGSDANSAEQHGVAMQAEMVMMVNDQGIPALGAIEAATKTNSELLGVSDRLGTVEKGKLADLLVVSGNPLVNITDLQNVRMVVQGGKIVVDNPE